MTNDWISYFCNVNERLASIFVNLGLGPEVPISAKPWLLWVWVYMKTPRSDGLSDGSEAPILFAIEDAIDLHVSKACAALPCGRTTTQGRREFYFYAEKTEGFQDALASAMATTGQYTFDSGFQMDAEWNQYLNVLYPTREQLQRAKNNELIHLLIEKGDRITTPRPIQHWMYFPSEERRGAFRDSAVTMGFQLEWEGRGDEDLPFGISVMRTEAIDQTALDKTVLTLLELAQQHQGDYDGWETPVITE